MLQETFSTLCGLCSSAQPEDKRYLAQVLRQYLGGTRYWCSRISHDSQTHCLIFDCLVDDAPATLAPARVIVRVQYTDKLSVVAYLPERECRFVAITDPISMVCSLFEVPLLPRK